MVQTIVEEVERLGAEGVVFISELHLPDGGGGELLVAALTDDGGRRVWHTPIERTAPRAVRFGRHGRRRAGAGVLTSRAARARRRRVKLRATAGPGHQASRPESSGGSRESGPIQ
jgi:hypothetical protein